MRLELRSKKDESREKQVIHKVKEEESEEHKGNIKEYSPQKVSGEEHQISKSTTSTSYCKTEDIEITKTSKNKLW